MLLCYSKTDRRTATTWCWSWLENSIPHHTQAGMVRLSILARSVWMSQRVVPGARPGATGARYLWNCPRNFVQIDPQQSPAHLFRVRRRVRSEHDFDYQ